jgi:hypothetical protein
MDALTKFIEGQPNTFDPAKLFDADVDKIESTIYDAPLIYKYYGPDRRSFFDKPQVRFSPRQALNDPFEGSVRWKKMSSEGLRNYIRDELERTLPLIFSDTALLVEMFKDELATSNGTVLSLEQETFVREFLAGDAAKAFIAEQLKKAQAVMPLILEIVFDRLDNDFQKISDKLDAKSGVLSLTEDPLNELTWAHYSNNSQGFVVGFDAKHEFFLNTAKGETNSVLRKVFYTNEKTENFWTNPYYLFLVKATGWSYEREWRMFKGYSDCDEHVEKDGSLVHLCNLPPQMIKTVHFGYAYDPANIDADLKGLEKLGSAVQGYQVEVDRTEGVMKARLLS